MENNEIVVSVCMLSYNHEKYIKKALDSVLMQKTNFKFEILIHDDASTDKSQEIIREYEEKYPDIVKPIYQTENQYSKGIKIWCQIQLPRAKGKYIAFCECDDYWCDPYKLQKQYDIMEQNEDCSMCVHDVLTISEDGRKVLRAHTGCNGLNKRIISDEDITKSTLRFDTAPFHTSSFFVRLNCISDAINNIPEFIKISPVGDLVLILYSALKGDFAYINEFMSHYRANSVGSYTQRTHFNKEYQISVRERLIKALILYNEYSDYKYNEYVNDYIICNDYIIDVLKKNYKNLKQDKYKNISKKFSKLKYLDTQTEIISNKLKIPQLYTFLYNTYRKFESRRWETIDEFNKKNNISY